MSRHADLLLVALVAGLALVLVVPLPGPVLDGLLALNLCVAGLVFASVLTSPRPVALSTFPSILLVTTLFRLSLNVASTRMILAEARGSAIVEAFGAFVARGDVVLGLVMFIVLTVVQLVVIGKGAERVAEVGARFSLDALPGRQMSIDAAVRSGSISEEEATDQRTELQRESQFYGAMDGAMKFVKGDAIAGIVIAALNLLAGLALGVMRFDMTLAEAAETFCLLTMGDGLVAQIPALLITLSAGLLTTRVASDGGSLGTLLHAELFRSPRALAAGAGISLGFAAVPGLPAWPFCCVALALAGFAWRSAEPATESSDKPKGAAVTPRPLPHPAARPEVEPTVAGLGADLSAHLTEELDLAGPRSELMNELVPQLRQALLDETGVRIPAVRVRINEAGLPPGGFRIRVFDVAVAEGCADPRFALACAPVEAMSSLGLDAKTAQHPVTGAPCTWIPRAHSGEAAAAGYRVWSAAGVLALVLAREARSHLPSFVTVPEVAARVDALERASPALVREMIPAEVNLAQLTEVIRRLVEEGVPVRDLARIIEAQAGGRSDIDARTEAARVGLGLQLTGPHIPAGGRLSAVLLAPELEAAVFEALQPHGDGKVLVLSPDLRAGFVRAIERAVAESASSKPVLVTQTEVRRVIRRLVQARLPHLSVLSYQELPASVPVEPIGRVEMPRPEPAVLSAG